MARPGWRNSAPLRTGALFLGALEQEPLAVDRRLPLTYFGQFAPRPFTQPCTGTLPVTLLSGRERCPFVFSQERLLADVVCSCLCSCSNRADNGFRLHPGEREELPWLGSWMEPQDAPLLYGRVSSRHCGLQKDAIPSAELPFHSEGRRFFPPKSQAGTRQAVAASQATTTGLSAVRQLSTDNRLTEKP